MNDAHRQRPEYSIVVPVYNSGAWLAELALRIESVMTSLSTAWELVLVNDRSPDQATWPAIAALAERYNWVRGIDLLYNVGQFRATLCGLEHAAGHYIITMDDDLQHPPEELPKLIEAMKQHPTMDCIMGKYRVKQHNALRNAGSWLQRKVMNRLYNKPPGLVTTSFRIMPASFAKTLCMYRIAAPQLGPLIVSITKRAINIPVLHQERKRGASGYSFLDCVQATIQSVVNGSILPLRWFSAIGFTTAACAFSLGVYYLVRWLVGGIGVAGFTSLILSLSFFSGMLLAGVGVLGEYIGRIIGEVTGMPRYHVRNFVGKENE